MDGRFSAEKFKFNEKIDVRFLHSLYEDDYPYIEEVFGTTLRELTASQQQIELAYKAGDITGLKKAVHKIKPSFGFVGLMETQESCRQFEDACLAATTLGQLTIQYQQLTGILEDSRKVVESEHQKLKRFNTGL
ncbi:MAG TPA: Hpt domain-containing protein [Flavitalea sp.]|nr:Hpt domain-containing protein [Flavitalea sp.]